MLLKHLANLPIQEVAKNCETIAYEIMTSMLAVKEYI
jgi:alanine racemase